MKQELRQGYTTGTCAQAATKAAIKMLLGIESGERMKSVQVELPKGKKMNLEIEDFKIKYIEAENRDMPVSVSCAVKKDSGDDPDITDGVLVYSKVTKTKEHQITITGGMGIGVVTKPGLDQPVGESAINRVPRQMIRREVEMACEEVGYGGGICVEISVPEGEHLAKKTFNSRLGIEGGISILGTSGIVEPMSEQALIDTIYLDMKVKLSSPENDRKILVVTPGNYGLEFLMEEYGVTEEQTVKCSNYIGQSIDMARELGCREFLLVGHIGKLVKVSGGIMNTHSKWADCRMELLAAAAIRAGLSETTCKKFFDCVTVDDAFDKCTDEERSMIMAQVMNKIEQYLTYRAEGEMKMGAMTFSKVYGILGKTSLADIIMESSKGRKE